MTIIRREAPHDVAGVLAVNEHAFGNTVEADLVDELRQACDK